MKKTTTLTSKITTFSTLVILTTCIIVTVMVYWTVDQFFYQTAISNLNNETRLIANDLENSFIKIQNNMLVLAKTPPIEGIIRSYQNAGNDTQGQSNLTLWKERLATIFQSMLEANQNYTQIRYLGVDSNGKEIVRVNQTSQGIHIVHDSALQAKANRDYFKLGLQLAPGSILFSDIDFNIEHNRLEYPLSPTIRCITPIYTNQQKLFGMLIININIQRYLKHTLQRSPIQDDLLIYDQYDNFFLYRYKTKELIFYDSKKRLNDGFLTNKTITSTRQIIPYLKQDDSRVTVFTPIYSNEERDQKVFTVAISKSKNTLSANNHSLTREILYSLLLLCALAAFSIYLFTRKTMRPLTKLAESIKAMGGHRDEPIKLPTELQDEVGLLARAFEEKTQQLQKLALHDSLTGLPNRRRFIDKLNVAIQKTNANNSALSLLYLDIDNFKEINDTYGHDHGDEILIQFAQKLNALSDENTYSARLGGDEFAILIQGSPSSSTTSATLKKYEASLHDVYRIKGVAIPVVVSAGIAQYPNDAIEANDLIRHADMAMYASKKDRKPPIHND